MSRGRLRAADNQTQGKVHGHIRPERRPVGPPVTQRCLWVRPRTGGSAGQVAGTRYPSQRLPATESPRHPLTWRPVASRLHDNQLALVPVGRSPGHLVPGGSCWLPLTWSPGRRYIR